MALEHIERRARRMRERREELQLTQEQVADRMQDTHRERHPDQEPDRTRGQMVSDWERAVNEPSPPKLELLAAALEWTVADLNTDQPSERNGAPDVIGALEPGEITEVSEALRALHEELLELRADVVELGIDQARDKAQERKWRAKARDSGS
jgi:transcriptional regulator with XRE-family HTH domain